MGSPRRRVTYNGGNRVSVSHNANRTIEIGNKQQGHTTKLDQSGGSAGDYLSSAGHMHATSTTMSHGGHDRVSSNGEAVALPLACTRWRGIQGKLVVQRN